MSQRDVPEWMPLYVYHFIADRNVQAMELDEIGAYFRLILTQWVNGSVPADRRELARLLHCDGETMERIWVALAPCYEVHPDLPGELIQGRVEAERAKALTRIEGNSKGGKTSAERRRGKPQVEKVLTGGGVRRGMVGHPNTEEDWDVERAFDELWEAYPSKGRVRRPMSQQYFCDKIRSRATFELALTAVKGKFAQSEKWAKGFVMALPEWINQECWNEDPEPVGGEKPGGPVYRKWEPPKPTE